MIEGARVFEERESAVEANVRAPERANVRAPERANVRAPERVPVQSRRIERCHRIQ
jgi:hypothetical protein